MKKLVSLILTLVLALSLAAPSFAAQTGSAEKTVGIILNNEPVSFPDAKPILKDGRTLAPCRQIIEAMGGKIAYNNDGTVTAAVGDTTFTFRYGSKEVSVSTGSKQSAMTLDVACCYRGGRTYIPIRFFAEALGYQVFWDSDDQSAVLVDAQGLIDRINENFTTINAALAKLKTDPSKTYKTSGTYNITLNLKDDSLGTVNGTIKINMSMISSATQLEMTGSADASALLALLDLEGAVRDGSMTALEAAMLRRSLSDVAFDLRCDLTTDTYYVHAPLLSALLTGAASIETDTWYKFSMGLDSSMLTATADSTMGDIVYAMAGVMAGMDGSMAGELYNDALDMGEMLSAILGDSSAVKSGSSCKWTLDTDKLNQLLGSEGLLDEMFKTFQVTLTAAADGSMKCTLNVQTVELDEETGSIGLSGEMTMSSSSAKINLTLNLGSSGSVTYALTMNMAETSETPKVVPPAGAAVVELGDLFGMMNPVTGLTGLAA